MNKFFKQKKASTLAVLILFIFVQFGGIFTPRTVHAQLFTFDSSSLLFKVMEAIDDITTSGIENAFIASLASTLMNSVMLTAAQIVKKAAINVASGGPGGSPLFETKTLETAAKLTGLNEAFDQITSIESSNSVLKNFGVDVPNDPKFLAAVRAGIKKDAAGRKQKTGLVGIMGNFQSYALSVFTLEISTTRKSASILRVLSKSFDDNEFISGAKIQGKSYQSIKEAEQKKELELRESRGYLPERDPVTGEITKPASQVESEYNEALKKQKYLPFELAITSPDKEVLLQMGAYAGSLLGNAIFSGASNLLNKGPLEGLVNTLIDPFNEDSTRSAENIVDEASIEDRFKNLLTFKPIQITDYNLLTRLSSCPTQSFRDSPQLFSCALDTSFASAIARADIGLSLTLKDAIDAGYIDGDWALIPPSDNARNQDSNCYTYGFCHSNLVKLRKARIISIGWEMAATSQFNKQSNPVTLNEVINAFNQCDLSGVPTNENPWCHLIDPDWVLKYPQTQCRISGYGQLLTANGTANRAEECVDIQSCISENEDGTCSGGYGYCVREKNTWKFRGDVCPAEFASCLSFTSGDTSTNLLTNTVDFGGCNSDTAGCEWYATEKIEDGDQNFDWPQIHDTELVLEQSDVYSNRIYFNGDVEVCNDSEGGCKELLRRSDGLSLNLIQNSGFEADVNEDGIPDFWIQRPGGAIEYSTDDLESRGGSSAILQNSAGLVQHGIELDQGQFYTLSFYAKQASGTATASNIELRLSDSKLAQAVDLTGTSFRDDKCSIVNRDADAGNETILMDGTPEGSGYERFDCNFTSPILADKSSKISVELLINTTAIWYDDIQLEQSQTVTPAHGGYNTITTTQSSLVAKLPPSYLGCTGNSTDPSACDAYVQVCREADQGCSSYVPDNGDPTLTGIVTEVDVCPNACVGYDTFKQEPTLYEPTGAFPLFFIPDSAESCSEAAVGCDEFTNIATEEKEYFTYLRACVTEEQAELNIGGDNKGVYYTWEGSDQSGFQLKTWNLLSSNLSDAPCTTWTSSATGISCDDDADGNGFYDKFTAACDDHLDIFRNPDCREFYDAQGDIHYRQWSETVTVENECSTFRKTESTGEADCSTSGGYFDVTRGTCFYHADPDNSETCAEKDNGCRKYTGGSSRNSRLAFEELFEDGDLTQWDTFSPASIDLSNDSLASGGHSIQSTGAAFWTHSFNNGSTCEIENGCNSLASGLGAACTVSPGSQYCGTLSNDLFKDKTYTVSFWAKGNGNINAGFDKSFGSAVIQIDVPLQDGEIELTTEWKRYVFGPFDMNSREHPDFGADTVLLFNPVSGTSLFNIDNVVVREGEEDITVIKESWVTPAACDINLSGQSSPQYHLGCSNYVDQNLRVNNLRSISRLCSEDVIGCEGFYATEESEATNAKVIDVVCNNLDGDGDLLPDEAGSVVECRLKTVSGGGSYDALSPVLCSISAGNTSCEFDLEFNLSEEVRSRDAFAHISFKADTTLSPADRAVYAVIGPEDICASSSAGCQEVGLPILSPDKSSVESWQSVWLMNDPDLYDQILCNEDSLYCEVWDAGTSGTWYFKDPVNQQCEFRTDVVIEGQGYTGWFREGTTNFCYGSGTCSNNALTCSTDSDCRVGICSGDSSSCTSDFDCSGTQACNVDEGASCEITDGSFVIGGDQSGIFRNGDEQFESWSGLCTADWNRCSEFRDPLDFDDNRLYGETDGTAYYFINNDSLNESGLLSSEKCGGNISPKKGCALFNDSGVPGFRYNASATYIASNHADTLFGKRKFDLVEPISCDDGAIFSTIETARDGSIDLCARRCSYPNNEVRPLTFGSDPEPEFAFDLYTFGSSCLISSDCQGIESETGDIVQGECVEVVSPFPGTTVSTKSFVPRLTDDTNRVLKVNQDRQCSEWLACASSQTVWDSETSSYRTVCDAIDLCTEYSSSGDASFCSRWDSDDSPSVLNEARYALRDVTWYGEEYSGYAIPDLFPIQYLSQVDVSFERVCDENSESRIGFSCLDDSECGLGDCIENTVADLRLGFKAGECTETNGDPCTIGFCENNGAACSDDSACGGLNNAGDSARCISGQCYQKLASSCEVDLDCSAANETCLAGECVIDQGVCSLDGSCAVFGAECIKSVATKTGSCFNDSCVLSAQGRRFNNEIAERITCRVNPEIDSPFGNHIVTSWVDAEDLLNIDENPTPGSDFNLRSLPYEVKSGFENVNLCAPGENCECSYKKLTSKVRIETYVSSKQNIDSLTNEISGGVGGRLGICSGGDVNGLLCASDNDCNDSSAVDSVFSRCNPITREDTMLGLEGYCLERDTGININGDPSTGVCLTWFPVDKLESSTDLFAKHKTAGFFEKVFMCTEVVMFADLKISKATPGVYTDGSIACAETDGACEDKSSVSRLTGCSRNVACPSGFYGIVAECATTKNMALNTYAYACTESSRNDCPYICVPENSVHVDDDDLPVCSPPDGGYITSTEIGSNTKVYNFVAESRNDKGITNAGYQEFNDLVDSYRDCKEQGRIYSNVYSSVVQYPCATGSGGSSTSACQKSTDSGFRYLYNAVEFYPACKKLSEVSSENNSYAWTDRLFEQSGYSISDDLPFLNYEFGTLPEPFGASRIDPANITMSEPPIRVAACRLGPNIVMPGGDNFDQCDGVQLSPGHNPSDPEIRSFISFKFDALGLSPTSVNNSPSAWTVLGETWATAFNRITQLFAQIYFPNYPNSYNWVEELLSYDEPGFTTSFDVRDDFGKPPKIIAIDSRKCFGSYCEEGQENAMTLNGENFGDHFGTGGFFRAQLKFYAAADKNQLPIRRVIVDWQDGTTKSGSSAPDNFFKNHRGLEVDSRTRTICERCTDGSEDCEWGMTPESCDANFFSYQHNYSCSQADILQYDACIYDGTKILNSPCKDPAKDICVYQPRVHIRDNWGWCTGVCTFNGSADKDNPGCFDATFSGLVSNNANSECNYEDYPSDSDSTADPWVYYDGEIRVEVE